jgi:hypothetical protein
MTREDILAEVREIRPNEYQDEWALKQVDELRQRILRELMAGYIVPSEGGELMTPSPYHKVYVYWMLVQIDLANSDYDRYNNDLQMFNSAWEEYSRYVSRTFRREHYQGFRI